MFMDSATSPSVPSRMTGQRHTARSESFRTRESNWKEICCYDHWFWIDVMCIGIGLMLSASVMDWRQVNWFLKDSFLLERSKAVHFVLFVVADFNELVFCPNLSPHPHVILHAGLARSCRIHCFNKRRKTFSPGKRYPPNGWGVGESVFVWPSPTIVCDAPPSPGEQGLSFGRMDSATSPSAPRTMTGQRHTFEGWKFSD